MNNKLDCMVQNIHTLTKQYETYANIAKGVSEEIMDIAKCQKNTTVNARNAETFQEIMREKKNKEIQQTKEREAREVNVLSAMSTRHQTKTKR